MYSNKSVILAGNNKEPLIIYVETDIVVEAIPLFYGSKDKLNESVQMYDNGVGIDDIAGDGIYSVKVELDINSDEKIHFVAKYDEKESNEIVVDYYLPIEAITYDAIDNVEEAIQKMKASEEFKNMDDDNRINAITSLLGDFEKIGQIQEGSIYINSENFMISYMYPEGILAGVTYKNTEFDSYMNSEKNIVDPSSESASNIMNDISSSDDDTEVEIVGKAVILNSFPTFETDIEKINYRTDFYNTLRTHWNQKGLDTIVIINPTVNDYKKLDQYNVIGIATHGSIYSWNDGFLWLNYHEYPVICLAESETKDKNKSYQVELKDKQIVIVDGRYRILPAFIEKQYSSTALSDSFVFSECCQAMGKGKGDNSADYDYSMANAFVSRSTKAYTGFHNSVFADYSREFMEEYVDRLIDGETSQQSYNSAITKMGENHQVWYNNRHSHTLQHYYEHLKTPTETYDAQLHVAYPVINGNRNSVLVNTGIQNGGFEDYSVVISSPKLWKCDGDIRTISQLGSVKTYSTSSKRMAIVTSGIGAKTTAVLTGGTEGSKLSQTFKIPNSATKISFKYNFISEEPMEYVGSKFDDSFVVQVTKGKKILYDHTYESINSSVWKPTKDIDFIGGDHTSYQTEWKTGEIDVSEYRNKTVTLNFCIYDVGDTIFDSAVCIDDVMID